MKRAGYGPYGGPIERAAVLAGGSVSDDAIRARVATAPPAVKAAIDRGREARGLAPLWRELGAVAPAVPRPVPPPPAPVKAATAPASAAPRFKLPRVAVRATSPGEIILAGAVCPGLSCPLPVGFGGAFIRERFSRRAFDESLAMIAAGSKVVDLRDGHDGQVIARTADGGLEFEVIPFVGLSIVARVPAAAGRWPIVADAFRGEIGFSVEFAAKRSAIVQSTGGDDVRVIHEAVLLHVALCRPVNGRPAYDSRAVAVRASKPGAESIARCSGVLAASRIVAAQLAKGW